MCVCRSDARIIKIPADRSYDRARWGILQLFLWAIRCAIFAIFLSPGNSAAQGQVSVTFENGSAGLFSEIRTECDPEGSRETVKEWGIDNLPIVFDGSLGAVAIVGTGHAIGPLEAKNKAIGLLISNYAARDRCDTFLFLVEPVARRKAKVTSAYSGDEFFSSGLADEIEIFNQLLVRCQQMGASASSNFTGGEYLIVGDQVVSMDGGFTCLSAVQRNTSSTKILLDKNEIAITIIGERIFVKGR